MNNLVIVMAGNHSLHEKYAVDRDFELWVCFWGDDEKVADRYRQSCDRLFVIKGQKWALVRDVGRVAREQSLPSFSSYDFVLLPDDDIDFPDGAAGISRSFALAREINADIFQPAIANQYCSPGWDMTLRVEGVVCRAVSMVEIMMSGYRGDVFEKCLLPLLHVHGYVTVGWSIPAFLNRTVEAVFHRAVRNFILDETPAIHTRPVGSGTSSYGIGRDEAFLTPYAYSYRHVSIASFTDRADARRYAFPPTDDFIQPWAVEKHLMLVRGARRLHQYAFGKGIGPFIVKRIQKLAARALKD